MMDVARAKEFLEGEGYVVVLRAEPGWQEQAFLLNEEYIAIKLVGGQCDFIRPTELCNLIGIERHTLYRNLKRPDCPKVKQERGPKRNLVRIQPTPEFIQYLLRNKRSSS
jgi:hypothetical protein